MPKVAIELGKSGIDRQARVQPRSSGLTRRTGTWSDCASRSTRQSSLSARLRLISSPTRFWRSQGATSAVESDASTSRCSRRDGCNSLLPLSRDDRDAAFRTAGRQVGKRASFMMFGSFLLMPVYLMMAYTNISLYVPVVADGNRLLADPGGHVAFGGLHRRPVAAGNGLCPHDV